MDFLVLISETISFTDNLRSKLISNLKEDEIFILTPEMDNETLENLVSFFKKYRIEMTSKLQKNTNPSTILDLVRSKTTTEVKILVVLCNKITNKILNTFVEEYGMDDYCSVSRDINPVISIFVPEKKFILNIIN